VWLFGLPIQTVIHISNQRYTATLRYAIWMTPDYINFIDFALLALRRPLSDAIVIGPASHWWAADDIMLAKSINLKKCHHSIERI